MPEPTRPEILPGTCWRHTNGATYIVLAIGNDYPDPRPNYPPTVIYCNRAGKLHTGRADDWHRRMTRIERLYDLTTALYKTIGSLMDTIYAA